MPQHDPGLLDDGTLYALALACPRCEALGSCPLSEIRKLSLAARFRAIREMPLERKMEVLKEHHRCLGSASPAELKHGPLVDCCLAILQLERRLGTRHERPGDIDEVVRLSHELKNMVAIRLLSEE